MATHNKRSKEKIAISLSRCLPAASVPPPRGLPMKQSATRLCNAMSALSVRAMLTESSARVVLVHVQSPITAIIYDYYCFIASRCALCLCGLGVN